MAVPVDANEYRGELKVGAITTAQTSLLPPTKTDEDVRNEMRLECERVWATFFLEGAVKELNVEEGVKTALEKGLEAGGWRESDPPLVFASS